MRKKECHLIPDEEKQCVWMTTGLIAYKLCTREFHCEDCIFDQVMRNEATAASRPDYHETASAVVSLSLSSESSLQMNGALFYHQHHCWAKVEDPDVVRIGIDGILARLVAKTKAVVLPQNGEAVKEGQCFSHIIQERHIVPVVAPLNGTVLSVNTQLKNNPERIANDPWESGWLITIKPETLENDLRTLLFGKRAIEWYQKREQEVIAAGSALLNQNGTDLGPTLQDGGEKLTSLATILTSEQYYQMLDSLCRTEDPT